MTSTRAPLDSRPALAADLARAGYVPHPLAGGGGWFETALTLTRPGLLERAARVVAGLLPPDVDRLAARGAPAVALAAATSMRSDVALLVAESPTADGWRAAGEIFPGARVVLVEDVVLHGDHALASIAGLREAGVTVVAVVCLLDRGEGGRLRLEGQGLPVRSGFTEAELLAAA